MTVREREREKVKLETGRHTYRRSQSERVKGTVLKAPLRFSDRHEETHYAARQVKLFFSAFLFSSFLFCPHRLLS